MVGIPYLVVQCFWGEAFRFSESIVRPIWLGESRREMNLFKVRVWEASRLPINTER